MAFQDTFDGTNGTALATHDANWTSMFTGGAAVLNGSGAVTSSTPLAMFRYAGLGYTDQVAKVTLDTQVYPGGVMVRCGGTAGGSNDTGYFAFMVSGGTIVRIYKRTASTNTQLGSDSATQTFTAGDTIEIRATGTGTVTLTAHKNGGAAIVSTTDSSSPHNTGDPGLYLSDNSWLVRTFDADTIGGGGSVFAPVFFYRSLIGRQT